MIPVSEDFEKIISSGSVQVTDGSVTFSDTMERVFNLTVTINDVAVDLDNIFQINITEQGASGNKLSVGEFCRNQIQILASSTLAVNTSDVIKVTLSVDGASDIIPMGKFWVYEIENASSNYDITITGYSVPEAMNSLVTFSNTKASENLAVIESRTGMPILNKSVFDSVYTLDPTGSTIFDYLAAIAGIAGYNIRADRNGNLVPYCYPDIETADVYEIDEDIIFDDGMSVKGNKTTIESVKVTGADNSPKIIGTGYGIEYSNNLIVNPLAVANTIYNRYHNYEYTKMSLHYSGNPALELGDVVSVTDNTGTYYGLIMEQSFLLDGGLTGFIESYSDMSGRNIIPYSSIRANLEQVAGNSIVSTVYYYLENTGTTPSKTDPNWSTTQTWTDGKHKWRMEEVTYGSGYYERLDPEDITGNTGKGIVSKTDYYMLTSNYDAVTSPKEAYEVTKSGRTIAVTDPLAGYVEELSVTVNITQEGSGTPSATNIRPFVSVYVCTINRNDGTESNDYPFYFDENVYQGTVNIYEGLIYSDWRYIEQYNGEDLPGEWLSDRDVYSPGTKPSIDAEVLYKLDTQDIIETTPLSFYLKGGRATLSVDLPSMSITYYEQKAGTWGTETKDTNVQNRYLWWKYTELYNDNSSYTSDPALINLYTETKEYKFWKVVNEDSSAPAKPTSIVVLPPEGWTDKRPDVGVLDGKSVYYVDLSVYADGTFEYGRVLIDSDVEDTKQAYFKALLAQEQANTLKSIFNNSTSKQAFDRLTEGGVLQGLFTSADGYAYLNADFIKAGSIEADKIAVTDLYALAATIGGFQIDADSIHTSNVPVTSNADNSIALSSNLYGFTRSIGSDSISGLKLAIGSKFGVTTDGTLYASNGRFSGTISGSVIEFGTGDFRLIGSYGEWEDTYIDATISVTEPTYGGEGSQEGSSSITVNENGSVTVGGVLFQGAGSAKFAVGTVFELTVKSELADTTSDDLSVLYANKDLSIFSDPDEDGYDLRFANDTTTNQREFYIERKQSIALCSKNSELWSGYSLTVNGGSVVLGKSESGLGSVDTTSLRLNPNTSEQSVLIGYGGDQYGIGVHLGGAGTTVVGAGEAGKNIISNNINTAQAGSDETLHLASDHNIYFYSNCQTIANRKQMIFNTNGNLVLPGTGLLNGYEMFPTWQALTRNSTYVTSGQAWYYRTGKIIVLYFSDVTFSTTAHSGSNATNHVAFSGLPTTDGSYTFVVTPYGSNYYGMRLQARADGKIYFHYTTNPNANYQYYGFAVIGRDYV